MSRLEGNIRKLVIMRCLLYSWVTIPTLALFYLDRGLSLSDLILFKSVLSGVSLACEIPSGYMADVWGRKKTGIVGCLFWLLSICFYIFGEGYFHFLCAEILLGIAAALLSGIDSAIAYDSLLASGALHRYRKAESRLSSVSGLSEACGGLLGAFLASLSLVYPFYLQLGLVFASLLVMFTLIEPPRNKQGISELSAWQGIMHTVSQVLRRDRGLQSLTLFYSISASGTLLLVWMAQGYMKAIELEIVYYGVLWAFFHIIMAFGSSIAHRLDSVTGSNRMLWLIIFVSSGAFLIPGLTESAVGLFAIALLYFIRGIRTPLFKFYINRITPSEVRATVLSVQGFGVRAVALVLGPMLALVVDTASLSVAFLGMAIFSLAALIIAIRKIQRTGVLEASYKSSLGKP